MSHELRNFEEGFKQGKIAGYLLGLKHGKDSGLKIAFSGIPATQCCDSYSKWLEQQIQELENAKIT